MLLSHGAAIASRERKNVISRRFKLKLMYNSIQKIAASINSKLDWVSATPS